MEPVPLYVQCLFAIAKKESLRLKVVYTAPREIIADMIRVLPHHDSKAVIGIKVPRLSEVETVLQYRYKNTGVYYDEHSLSIEAKLLMKGSRLFSQCYPSTYEPKNKLEAKRYRAVARFFDEHPELECAPLVIKNRPGEPTSFINCSRVFSRTVSWEYETDGGYITRPREVIECLEVGDWPRKIMAVYQGWLHTEINL